jgi:glycerol-3-phosphate dehydrogenase (NAD(P)+)
MVKIKTETLPARERVAVLGAGSWGATLAALLADKGHDVALWEFDPKAAAALAATRRLPVLPGLELPASIHVTSDLAGALEGRRVVISATPSHFVRATMAAVRKTGALAKNAVIVSVAKGLEEKTLKRMSEVIREELCLSLKNITALTGPSHAEEVCRRMPTATIVAGVNTSTVARVQALFQNDFFRVYPHEDLAGAELAGALKNIFAIVCGVSDGLGLGDNSRAAILTRGLNEMTRIGVRLGGDPLTFFGLAGMGDLIVTCLSRHSRNRLLGEKIGTGKTAQQALSEMTMVAEGMKTAPSAYALSQKLKLDCPLTREIYEILYQGKNPRASLHDLMHRQTQGEWKGLPKKKRILL